jgi:hypothetical protein
LEVTTISKVRPVIRKAGFFIGARVSCQTKRRATSCPIYKPS